MSTPDYQTRSTYVAVRLLALVLVGVLSAFRPAPVPIGPPGVTATKGGGGGVTGGPPLARPQVSTIP